jgi:hypothetical protein
MSDCDIDRLAAKYESRANEIALLRDRAVLSAAAAAAAAGYAADQFPLHVISQQHNLPTHN